MFKIVCIDPLHCQITDGIIGSTCRDTGRRYRSEALALKIAARLEDEAYENCSDSAFHVISAEGRRCIRPVAPIDYDAIPF